MLNVLLVSLKLKITYWVNSRLYGLRQIPGLKKIISDTVFSWGWVKSLLMTFGVIREVVYAFIFKFFYGIAMLVLPVIFSDIIGLSVDGLIEGTQTLSFDAKDIWAPILHVFLFLTFAGGITNNDFFEATMDKHYAINLLRLDPRKYTLTNFGYFLLRSFMGFALLAFVSCKVFELPLWWTLLIPFFVASVKVIFANLNLLDYKIRNNPIMKKMGNIPRIILVFVFLVIGYGSIPVKWFVPEKVAFFIMLGTVVLGLASSWAIIRFPNYRGFCKYKIQEFLDTLGMIEKSMKVSAKKTIEKDPLTATSNKKGFEFLNELFIKRHRRILWKRAMILSLISLAVIGVGIVVMILPWISIDIKEGIRDVILNSFTIFPFILYLMNRGREFTNILFMNCDHCLLTYSMFKEPRHILHLFRLRLVEISKINLLPATVIGVGLAIIMLVSGGTDNVLYYPLIVLAPMGISIFFSVHYLVLYYLLQPYNKETEVKSFLYSIIMGVTYLPCYLLVQADIDLLPFSLGAILFSVVYSVVALVLVYKFAPRTFRIRT